MDALHLFFDVKIVHFVALILKKVLVEGQSHGMKEYFSRKATTHGSLD